MLWPSHGGADWTDCIGIGQLSVASTPMYSALVPVSQCRSLAVRVASASGHAVERATCFFATFENAAPVGRARSSGAGGGGGSGYTAARCHTSPVAMASRRRGSGGGGGALLEEGALPSTGSRGYADAQERAQSSKVPPPVWLVHVGLIINQMAFGGGAVVGKAGLKHLHPIIFAFIRESL